MKTSYWMTSVVNHYLKYSKIKNSELCSLFLIALSRLTKGLVIFIVFILLSACQPTEKQQRVTFSGPIMGTDYRITLILNHDQLSDQLESKLVDAMQSVNQAMSTYISNSELSLINNASIDTPIALSDGMRDVLGESLSIGELSNGAFDITIGKAVNLWGFGPNGSINSTPSEKQLTILKKSVGYQHLHIKAGELTKEAAGISIDLSAIAKGYAVDQVSNKLKKLNINNYLIDIGGELFASGYAGKDKQWSIGIEKPHDLGGIQQIISLRDKAIATSGDYRNYHTIDGEKFSHTIDAVSLKPVFHRLALVSVISDKASTADALATTIMAMGEVRGFEFAKKNKLAVYMIVRDNSEQQYRVVMTDYFQDYLK